MKQCDKKSLLTLCLGAAGMSLRLLQNMTGFEPGTGLPIPGSIPGILLPVLLALSAVILFRMNSKLPKGPVEVPLSRLLNWNDKEGLFGILAGGCVMAFSGVLEIANAFGRTVTAVSADGMEIVTVSAGTGRSGVVMGLLAVVAGICLLAGVGAVAAFAVLTAAGFVLMACAALFTVTMLAHIQAQTPATLVGKVVSLLLTVSLCAQPAGQALYGVLLEQLAGGEGWVLLGAACGAMIVAAAARRVAYSAASCSSRCMAETS